MKSLANYTPFVGSFLNLKMLPGQWIFQADLFLFPTGDGILACAMRIWNLQLLPLCKKSGHLIHYPRKGAWPSKLKPKVYIKYVYFPVIMMALA